MGVRRVLVVDDSRMYQRLLSDVINSHPELEVVDVAVDGREALQKVDQWKPHVVTLDILMPHMDGIQTLLELRRRWPTVRIIMISSLTREGSDAALDALTLGAHEYAAKPSPAGGIQPLREALAADLLPKIEALCGIDLPGPGQKKAARHPPAASPAKHAPAKLSSDTARAQSHVVRPELVVIGVSTGGPDALTKLLLQIPGDFELPICVVQHMPAEFTPRLAARLDAASDLNVREARMGDKLHPGFVYIAPGDFHMVLEKAGQDDLVSLNKNPLENSCRPSVDPLFRSAAALHGAYCLGIVMTGMGRDGLRGAEALYAAGASILVQDQASSVVWGMPRLVAQAGLADEQVPLQRMAQAILARVRNPQPLGERIVAEPDGNAANAIRHGSAVTRGHGS